MAQYNGQQDVKTIRRYFSGTTTLRKGQIIHYNEAASKTGTLPNRLGVEVEAVNSDNIKFFAGVVPDSEAGKVGPCWVELLQPQQGDIVEVEADGTTDIAVGDFLEPDATLGALIDGTEAAGDNLFIACEAYTTDATKQAILAQRV